jgi:segregation and condensation protein A
VSEEATVPQDDASHSEQAYRVRLEVFEGPLDLLLHLIEKQELDITTVSLAAVTDQYLDYISQLEYIHAETLADFLAVAAKLLLIKSRALLPAPPGAGEEETEDVGDDLVRQLREYKKFKELAKRLREREELGLHSYLRVASLPRLEPRLDLSDVTLNDLLEAVRQALAVEPLAPPVDGVVGPMTFTIGEKIEVIEALLARKHSFRFQSLLLKATSRPEIIVTFLALLELIKGRRIRVQQDKLFGVIVVSRAEEPAPQPVAQEQP